jgi:hypothetical protein
MTINEIIRELERFDGDTVVLLKYNHVEDNWGEIDSYRGYYSEVAVDTGAVSRDVCGVICDLKSARGSTYVGYKGGSYTMTGDTGLYWAEYGCLGPIASKVYLCNDVVYIECEED